MGIGNHEKPNKGATDVWLTPISIVRALGPFDFDPCGEAAHPTAARILTSNGLTQEWPMRGKIWLNPPYSEVGEWVEKLGQHCRRTSATGVTLLFARTETKWFQDTVDKYASGLFFPRGRIKFLRRDGTPGKWTSGAPSVFISFGYTPDWSLLGMPGFSAKVDQIFGGKECKK